VEEIVGDLSDSESDDSSEEVTEVRPATQVFQEQLHHPQERRQRERLPPPQQQPRQREERPSSPNNREERPSSLRQPEERPSSPFQGEDMIGSQHQEDDRQSSLHQGEERQRPSSSMSNRSPSLGGGSSTTPRRRILLGPFIKTINGRTGISSANHAAGIIGILQLASGHENGFLGSLGQNSRLAWFQENIEAIFQTGGPLGMFKVVTAPVLARHFGNAQSHAKEFFDRYHSADQSGASHEDVPPWVQHFFRMFETLQNITSASSQAAATRNERRSVVAGVMGRQATLGSHPGNRTVPIRTETARNAGTPRQRQMHMGNFNVEVLGDETMNERLLEDEFLVEGLDDVMEERPARRRRYNSGVRRRNANIDFGPGRNDPAARFQHVTSAFSLLDALTNAVAQSFSAPAAVAPRTLMDVAMDFDRATEMLFRARERNDTIAVNFYEALRQDYIDERERILNSTHPNED
jgi:hypothetical protein